jgi:hypothetical protein
MELSLEEKISSSYREFVLQAAAQMNAYLVYVFKRIV